MRHAGPIGTKQDEAQKEPKSRIERTENKTGSRCQTKRTKLDSNRSKNPSCVLEQKRNREKSGPHLTGSRELEKTEPDLPGKDLTGTGLEIKSIKTNIKQSTTIAN